MNKLRVKVKYIVYFIKNFYDLLFRVMGVTNLVKGWLNSKITFERFLSMVQFSTLVDISDQKDGRGDVLDEIERQMRATRAALNQLWTEMSGDERVIYHRRFSQRSDNNAVDFVDDVRFPSQLRQRFKELYEQQLVDGIRARPVSTVLVSNIYLHRYEKMCEGE